MDVESFYECLGYVQLVQHGSFGASLADWVMPLVGVVVGFLLSSASALGRALWREGRLKRALLREVEFVKVQASITFEAAIKLAYALNVDSANRRDFQPSTTIELFLFERKYADVVHAFSTVQSHALALALAHAADVNKSAEWLLEHYRGDGATRIRNRAIDLVRDCGRLYSCCEAVVSGELKEDVEFPAVARSIGISEEIISAFSSK